MARNTQPPEGEPVVPTTDELETLTVPDAAGVEVEGSGKDGNVVKADLLAALDVPVDELEAQRQAALADADAASERANQLHRQIEEARGSENLQAVGLPPLIAVAESSAAALNPTPVED